MLRWLVIVSGAIEIAFGVSIFLFPAFRNRVNAWEQKLTHQRWRWRNFSVLRPSLSASPRSAPATS